MKVFVALVLLACIAACTARIPCDGFKDGKKCGCWKGWCWAFLNENDPAGSPWCYTQVEGFAKGNQRWAVCKENKDCSWSMPCGNNNTHVGEDNSQPTADELRCPMFKDGNKCGCYKGSCWAYLKETDKGGDPWCYTQTEGIAKGQGKFATCQGDRDCTWSMQCGSTLTHVGEDAADVPK